MINVFNTDSSRNGHNNDDDDEELNKSIYLLTNISRSMLISAVTKRVSNLLYWA